jgi:hypothetical protein
MPVPDPAAGTKVAGCSNLDLSAEDAQLLALADNKLGEIAEWNDEMLGRILEELKAANADLNASEPILYGWKPSASHHAVADRTQTTVWHERRRRRQASLHHHLNRIAVAVQLFAGSL